MTREKRIPPGQTETKKWPVLHYGEIPRYAPGKWDFRVFGLVDAERRWSLAELKALPQVETTSDIHCVTTWSRLDTTFRGVRVRDLLAGVTRRPGADFVLIHADPDYTTNLPLADLLSADPGSAALLLRVVNSPQFSLTTKISSVRHAITYLGANLVRDILLGNMINTDARSTDAQLERIHQRLWQSSYLASGLAFQLALQLRGGVEEGQFVAAERLRVFLGLALVEAHEALLLQEPCEQFADEQQDQAGMRQLDAGFLPAELETIKVRGDEVDEEQAADEVAAGENRDGDLRAGQAPHHEEAAEIFFLHRPDAEVDLVERGDEHQDEGEQQQDDRELERHEEVAELLVEGGCRHDQGALTVRRNAR